MVSKLCLIPPDLLYMILAYFNGPGLDTLRLVSRKFHALVLCSRLNQYGKRLFPEAHMNEEAFGECFEMYYRKIPRRERFCCLSSHSMQYRYIRGKKTYSSAIIFQFHFYKEIRGLGGSIEALFAALLVQGRFRDALDSPLRREIPADGKARLEARFGMSFQTKWAELSHSTLMDCLLAAASAGNHPLFSDLQSYLLNSNGIDTDTVKNKLAECSKCAIKRGHVGLASEATETAIKRFGYIPTLESLVELKFNNLHFLRSKFPPDVIDGQVSEGQLRNWMRFTVSLHCIHAFEFLYDLRHVPQELFDFLYRLALQCDLQSLKLLTYKAEATQRKLLDQTIQLAIILERDDLAGQKETFQYLVSESPCFDINGVGASGLTALQVAVRYDNTMLFGLLKHRGANISSPGKIQQTPEEILESQNQKSAIFIEKRRLISMILNKSAKDLFEKFPKPEGAEGALATLVQQISSVRAKTMGLQTINELLEMRETAHYDSVRKLQGLLFKFYKMIAESYAKNLNHVRFDEWSGNFVAQYIPELAEDFKMIDMIKYLLPKPYIEKEAVIPNAGLGRQIKNHAELLVTLDSKNEVMVYNLLEFFIPSLTGCDELHRLLPPLICFLIGNLSAGDFENLGAYIRSEAANAWYLMKIWESDDKRKKEIAVAWTLFFKECTMLFKTFEESFYHWEWVLQSSIFPL